VVATALRPTGISVVGNIPWGAHICHFYQTKQDLLDILIPYFKTGLENRELCVWVVFDPLDEAEAANELRRAFPEAERHLAAGDIEIIPHLQWYLRDGKFDLQRVIHNWQEQLAAAVAKGYAGMRVNGNEAWLTQEDWKEFSAYEKRLNEVLVGQPMLVLCTYPLALSSAAELFDVARTHEFAIARRDGKWEVLETPELAHTKEEIKRLNEELEQRVAERTAELGTANEELRNEIAERKRFEAAQKESRQFYESLVQSINGIVCEADGQTLRVTFVSKQAEKIMGYPVAEWTSEPDFWIKHLHPDDREEAVDAKLQVVATGENRQLEYRMIAADGRVVWFRDVLTLSVTRADALMLRGVMVDISERKRGEDELSKQKEILQQIFDHIPVMIGFWDEEGRIKLVNRAWEQTIGWTLAEMRGNNFDLLTESYPDPQQRQRALDFIAASDGEWADFKVRGKDGRTIHTTWAGVRLSDGTRITIGQDITARRRAEEELKNSNEKLRALSASLNSAREEEGTRIAREIHDELGSTLTSLRWGLEILDKDVSESGTASANLQALREKIASLLKLTDTTIGAVRRIASELRPSLLDDLGLVAAIEWHAQAFQAQTGIACRIVQAVEKVDLNPEQAIAVFRIFQEALTNIMRHARATAVEITASQEAGEFVLTISDNGRGITTEEALGSHSLGLLGMRERAHLVGGKIDFNGIAGAGTVVTVRVPVSDKADN
jgi:PAS domain S-box-containing protein